MELPIPCPLTPSPTPETLSSSEVAHQSVGELPPGLSGLSGIEVQQSAVPTLHPGTHRYCQRGLSKGTLIPAIGPLLLICFNPILAGPSSTSCIHSFVLFLFCFLIPLSPLYPLQN